MYLGTSVNVHILLLSFYWVSVGELSNLPELVFLICQVGKPFLALITEAKWYFLYKSFFMVVNTPNKLYLASAHSQKKKRAHLLWFSSSEMSEAPVYNTNQSVLLSHFISILNKLLRNICHRARPFTYFISLNLHKSPDDRMTV